MAPFQIRHLEVHGNSRFLFDQQLRMGFAGPSRCEAYFEFVSINIEGLWRVPFWRVDNTALLHARMQIILPQRNRLEP